MNTDKSIYDVISSCTLTHQQHKRLKNIVESLGMIYLATPFSREAMDRLLDLGIELVKVGSGECNNRPLIDYIAKHKIPMIISTGMNDIESIRKTVDVVEKHGTDYCLLHCTSLYPTPYKHVRLGGIRDLRDNFKNAVIGLSDHSIGNYTSFAAVPLGARIIEKHFTSSKTWPGPDIEISLDPKELEDLIVGVNAIFESLGGSKTVLSEEKPTIDFAYASVVAIKDIKIGQTLDNDNIWVKRPGTGDYLADDYESLIGKVAKRNIFKDEQIKRNDI
jgi:N-acetylneuraminate synthase